MDRITNIPYWANGHKAGKGYAWLNQDETHPFNTYEEAITPIKDGTMSDWATQDWGHGAKKGNLGEATNLIKGLDKNSVAYTDLNSIKDAKGLQEFLKKEGYQIVQDQRVGKQTLSALKHYIDVHNVPTNDYVMEDNKIVPIANTPEKGNHGGKDMFTNDDIRNASFNNFESLLKAYIKDGWEKNNFLTTLHDMALNLGWGPDASKWDKQTVEKALGVHGKYRSFGAGDYGDMSRAVGTWAGLYDGSPVATEKIRLTNIPNKNLQEPVVEGTSLVEFQLTPNGLAITPTRNLPAAGVVSIPTTSRAPSTTRTSARTSARNNTSLVFNGVNARLNENIDAGHLWMLRNSRLARLLGYDKINAITLNDDNVNSFTYRGHKFYLDSRGKLFEYIGKNADGSINSKPVNIGHVYLKDSNGARYHKKGGTMMYKFLEGGIAQLPSQEEQIDLYVALVDQGLQEQPEQVIASLEDAGDDGVQILVMAVSQNPDLINIIEPYADQSQVVSTALDIIDELMQQAKQQLAVEVASAKLGAKLNYLTTLSGGCPSGTKKVYYKKGGKVCAKCQVLKERAMKTLPITKNENGGQFIPYFSANLFKCGGKTKKVRKGEDGMLPKKRGNLNPNDTILVGKNKKPYAVTDKANKKGYPYPKGVKMTPAETKRYELKIERTYGYGD